MDLELELSDRVARRGVTLLPLRQAATRLRTVVLDPARSLRDLVDVVKVCPCSASATPSST